jgi:RNA polymerase sigma factor (TIGR02999 family)
MPSDLDSRIARTVLIASRGDPQAAADLLPMVYKELRSLARSRMAGVPPGNTLQPTALVHEAYMRLVKHGDPGWNGRGHFFGAAAQAMRQILVDQVREKKAVKRGGDRRRVNVDDVDIPFAPLQLDTMALHQALERLEADDPRKGRIVLLRYFAGLDRQETAECLGISARTVDREWEAIVLRLHKELSGEG